MTDAAGAVTVSAAELDLLCGLLGLDPPDALDIPAHRDRAPALPGSAGAPPITSALRGLSRAPLLLELHRSFPEPFATVVAVDATQAVLAARHGDRVEIRRLPPERATAAVLEQLPPLRPAPGRPVRVPVDVLTEAVAAAGDDADRLVVELMRRGMSGPGARSLVDANREVDAVFRIGVTVRRIDGPRHGPYRITLAHNASGHHCRPPSAGPPDALVTVPATARRLALEIDELVAVTAERPVQRRGAGRGSTRPADAGGIGSGTGANTW